MKVFLAVLACGVSGHALSREIHQVLDIDGIDLYCLVPTRCGQPLAVWTPGHAVNEVAVAAQGQKGLACVSVPHHRRLVPTSDGQPLSVRVPGHAGNFVRAGNFATVIAQGQQFLAGGPRPTLLLSGPHFR